jgi:hypothetical protein
MWKANLNRHFAKLLPAFRIAAFLILWSGLFHAFTLAILLLWSLTSNRVPDPHRMTILNQFLSENQILFAALGAVSALPFFKDPLIALWRERRAGLPLLVRSALRGLGFGAVMIIALVLNGDYEFLGLSSQVKLNFLADYAWILRSALIFVFVFSTEFLVRRIVHREIGPGILRTVLENLMLLALYGVWFSPEPSELPTLFLLFSIFGSFWSSTGFLSAFFILMHAVLGLDFFENETAGLLQLEPGRSDGNLLQNGHLRTMLVILLALIQYAKLRLRKESTTP